MNVSGYTYNVIGQQPQGGGGRTGGNYVNGQYYSPYSPQNYFTQPGQNQGVFDPTGTARSAWQKQQQGGGVPPTSLLGGGYNQLPTYGGQTQNPSGPLDAYIGGQGASLKSQQGSALGSWNLRSGTPVFEPYKNTYELQSMPASQAGKGSVAPGMGGSLAGDTISNPTNLPNATATPQNPNQYNPLTSYQPYGGSGTQNNPYSQGPAGGTMQGFYY